MKKKTLSKVKIIAVALVCMLLGVCLFLNKTEEVQAEETSVALDTTKYDYGFATYSGDTLSVVRECLDKNTIPTVSGTDTDKYLFAGWFKEEECTLNDAIRTSDEVLNGGTYYAKFVSEDVLNVKAQISDIAEEDIVEGTTLFNMRFVSSVDSLAYNKVGFKLVVEGDTTPKYNNSKMVFERIESATLNDDYKFSPKVVDTESEYFITATWKDIADYNQNFYVQAYWKTLDGVVIYGPSRYVCVNDGLNKNVVNVAVKGATTTSGTVAVSGGTDAATGMVAWHDGTYAHVRIDLGTDVDKKTALKSVTKFTVDGKEVFYRNLYTKYANTTATIDKSWYELYSTTTEDEFVIATSADLYGFANIVNSSSNPTGKTFYVVSDIEVNKGTATASKWDTTYTIDGTTYTNGTEYTWTPIGKSATYPFKCNFDGQGHTISGINETENDHFKGLFGWATDASVIQKFRLTNSCFIQSIPGNLYLGSIVGRSDGRIDSVYSDAIITNVGNWTGGIAGGHAQGTETSITNCQYAGTINVKGTTAQYVAGILGYQNAGTVTISDCLFSGNIYFVERTAKLDAFTAGICGSTKSNLNVNNSLVSGKIVSQASTTVSVDYVARVIAQIQDGTFTVNANNVYFTSEGLGANTHWFKIKSNATTSETIPEKVARADIIGNFGYFNTNLFKNNDNWTIVKADGDTVTADGTPILKSFADIVGVEPSIPEVVGNIDWYTGVSAPSYTICNNDANTDEGNAANVEELYGFAYLVREGIDFDDKTVSMLNDVTVNEGPMEEWDTETGEGLTPWTPIGVYGKPFAGTFDGADTEGVIHSISGLYGKQEKVCLGLFAQTAEGSRIQNLKLKDSYFENTVNYTGSVVSWCEGDIINVYSNATVKSGKSYNGGIVGYIVPNSGGINLTKCWFDGNLEVAGNMTGGIVGIVDGTGIVNVSNCLNSGDITHASTVKQLNYAGGLCGYTIDSTLTISNSLNVGMIDGGTATNGIGSILGNINKNAVVKVIDVYTTDTSYQYNKQPVAIGATTTIAEEKYCVCAENDITGKLAYFNIDFVRNDEWVITAGTPELKMFSVVQQDKPVPDGNIDWYTGLVNKTYTICAAEDDDATKVNKLYGFAYLVNQGITFSGKTVNLGADVTVNEVSLNPNDAIYTSGESDWDETLASAEQWTPIGNKINRMFAGTFDGQGNTISGICATTTTNWVGLFGLTDTGSKIMNFQLTNSYFALPSNGVLIGSIVGRGSGSIHTVYSDATITSEKTHVGGIVGGNWGATEESIANCQYDGTIYMKGNSAQYAGGIIGYQNSGTLTINDCLFSGEIDFVDRTVRADVFTAGICGSTMSNLNINNSLVSGKIISQASTTVGVDYVARVIAQIQNGTFTVNSNNVYFTSEGLGANTHWFKIKSNATTSETIPVKVAEADITGDLAYYNTKLFRYDTDKWALVADGAPILADFATVAGVETSPEPTIDEGTDIAWYTGLGTDSYAICTHDPETEENANVLNAQELYGLGYLVNEVGIYFSGKTVSMEHDAEINADAPKTYDAWATYLADNTDAVKEWTPIGTETYPDGTTVTKVFQGTFDGQGHSISGIYVDEEVNYMGFFGVTGYGSEIKDFKILNSYFKQQATYDDSFGFVGSVAGELRGSMSGVYSNAIVESGFKQIAGLVARTKCAAGTNPTPVTITDCWYDGNIYAGTTGRYIGGIVASVVRGSLELENILFTGIIDADYTQETNGEVKAVYIGGIVGETYDVDITLSLKSVISAGSIVGNNNHMLCNSILGQAKTGTGGNTTLVTLENVFATRDCAETACATGPIQDATGYEYEDILDVPEGTAVSTATLEGTVLQTTGDDRLIGYIAQKMVTGTDAETGENIVTDIILDFTENWSLRTDGVPVPTKLVDMATNVISSPDAKTMAEEIGLDYWNAEAEITNAESYGAGNYQVIYDLTTDGPTYEGYIAKLVDELKFEFYADNSAEDENSISDMNSDGVYASTYYKKATATAGEWVLNITYVEKESKIYISINTDLNSRDDNLQSAKQGESLAISLGMIEQVYTTQEGETKYDYGNSFAFQLPDGHFIVNDGGRAANADELVAYLKEQATAAGLDGVYIDAWIISHYHDDHCGALSAFFEDPTLRDGVYLKAVYASEPSAYALDAVEDQLGVMNLALRGAMTLTQAPVAEGGTAEKPDVYQLHMGQRYYFNGMTMDVIDTQEQHPVSTWGDKNVPDAFNTSSTNCVFTFTDGNGTAKKVLIGGDATTVNMEYIMEVYGNENGESKTLHDIDVFAAYHHGHNTTAVYEEGTNLLVYNYKGKANYDWANFLLNNNTDSKFDVVLFPYYKVYEMNWVLGSGYVGDDGNKDYPYNIGEINDYFAKNSAAYYTYGYDDCLTTYTESNPHGTVKLTFGTTIEVKAYESLKTAQ